MKATVTPKKRPLKRDLYSPYASVSFLKPVYEQILVRMRREGASFVDVVRRLVDVGLENDK